MGANFQELLIRELREYFRPILATADDPENIFTFLEMIGWYVRPALSTVGENDLIAAFIAMRDLAKTFAAGAGNAIEDAEHLRIAFTNVLEVVNGVEQLRTTLGSVSGLDASQFVGDVLNALSVLYIHRNHPFVFALLQLLTVIGFDAETNVTHGNAVRVGKQFIQLRLDRLGDIVTDPLGALKSEYFPNTIQHRAEAIAVANRLFPRVAEVLTFLCEQAPVMAAFGAGGAPLDQLSQADEDRLGAMLTFWWDWPDDQGSLGVRTGASVGILAGDDGGPGAFVVPFGTASFTHPIDRWLVALSGAYDPAGFKITKDNVDYYATSGTIPQASLILAPELKSGPALLIGSTAGTRLESKEYWIEAEAVFTKPSFEISTFVRLKNAALVIAPGEGDGFLQAILPPQGLRADFDLGIGWSNLRGFHIEGSGSLEYRVPLHLAIGPVEIPGVTIKAGFAKSDTMDSHGSIPLSIGCDVTAKLGPLTAVVQNMGLRLDFSFPARGGNLGPLDWDPKFKPPTGIGLSIDGGGFTGGGLISLDPEKHLYSGLLELKFQNSFAVNAIGLLDTEPPGVASGYSLLIVISTEFAPIQLGFGFTLNGVGGLLGLNRTTDIDALRAGVKTGSFDSILFPADVVANATRIISDLGAIFLPAEGRFILGPMAKIGWGTPTLVEIELGLMIEGMSPWSFTIPGVVRTVLPDKDHVILQLQVNFLGRWEQDKKTITFYSSLYESRLLSMPLTGDMAFLMRYGDNPVFVLVAGGFSPSFAAPALPFEPFKRLALTIRNDGALRIVLSSYFAVTSNTAQFGCAVDLKASHGKYSVEGQLSFDALFHFAPFAMTVDLAATLTLRRNSKVMFGVQVYATLSGPAPWSARGTASFTILREDIDFHFSHVWGDNRNTTLQSTKVLDELVPALGNPGNWETIAPEYAQNLVTLRPLDAGEAGKLLLRPDGALTVRQKVVPLDFTIAMFGNCEPDGDRRFTIKQVRMGGQIVPQTILRDEFAPAQFESLSDAQKLSRKSFEMMPSGIRTSGTGLSAATSAAVGRDIDYAVKIVDARTLFYYPAAYHPESLVNFNFLLNGNSAGRFSGSYFNAQYSANPGPVVQAAQEGFSVVGMNDLRRLSNGVTFVSQAEAHDHLAALVANDPSLAEAIQVVPNYLAREAA